MLLETYRREIFRSKCQSTVESLHCFGHLDQDVREVLPYLNTTLGGFEYTRDPPSVTFKAYGKLITVHPRKIAINALKDEAEADKILEWLKGEINDAWERRAEIEPCYEGVSKPRIIEILRLLPKTTVRFPTGITWVTLPPSFLRIRLLVPAAGLASFSSPPFAGAAFPFTLIFLANPAARNPYMALQAANSPQGEFWHTSPTLLLPSINPKTDFSSLRRCVLASFLWTSPLT